ncbi:MAG: exosortase/archaeosortase family protein [Opitutales bacterium]
MQLRRQLATSLKEKIRLPDFWFNCGVFTLLGFIFLPITFWFTASTQEQSRLFHALVVLGLATVMLVRYGGVEIKDTLSLNPSARRALIASFVLLLAQFISARAAPLEWRGMISLLAIPAYCCGLAAFFRFVFGEGTRRITRTAAGTFCAFLLLSIFMQPLDWPLRGLAGTWSASALQWMGQSVELGLVGASGDTPMLILSVAEHPFHVASECNGFGVILTSVLIGLLLALHRRMGLLDTGLNMIAGLVIGFIFNILRIVIIVLLAPYMMDHYMLMHEIVGGITYWGCLILIWVALKGPTGDESQAEGDSISRSLT